MLTARVVAAARSLAPLAAFAAAAVLLSGCALVPPTTSLRVKGSPPDASVTIDDQYLGALAYVAAHGVALPPGKHRITVEKAGFFPWDMGVEANNEPIHLEVVLTRIPD
jgi:hypothetical protein